MRKTSTISRREALSGLAIIPAISTTTISAEANSSDKDLIALGREFDTITTTLDDALSRAPPSNELGQKIYRQQLDDLFHRLGSAKVAIEAAEAKTLEGLQAKARVVCWARLGDLDPFGQTSMDQRMAFSIVRDLIRLYDPKLERPGALKKLM